MIHQTQAQLQPVTPEAPALDTPEHENLEIEAARGQNSVTRIVRALAQRRLGLTALLFIAAHEPAAFLAGQCLYLLAPTYRMLTADTVCDRVAFVVDGRIVACDEPRSLRLAHGRRRVRIEHRADDGLVAEEMSLKRASRRLVELLETGVVETIHTEEATLDEVFTAVTGRAL
jgi:hypothetical protein